MLLTRKPWSLVILTVVAVAVVALLILVLTRPSGSQSVPSRLASGPSLWVGVPVEERKYCLDDLLGQHWERNYVIPDLTKTKLNGLNKAQVLRFLGPTPGMQDASDELWYKLGDLREDKDVLDSAIEAITPGAVSGMDYLMILFDSQSGLVSEVRIAS